MANLSEDKRKYVRLDTLFPVEFIPVKVPDSLLGIDWQYGGTHNVSEGGMCLETKALNEAMVRHIMKEGIQLELKILMVPPIRAIADIVWHRENDGMLTLGLQFRTIKKEDVRRLMGHAYWFARLWVLAWVLAVGIISFAIFIRFFHIIL